MSKKRCKVSGFDEEDINEVLIRYARTGNCFPEFIEYNADNIDINYQDDSGRTAAHYIASYGYRKKYFDIILEKSDFDIRDKKGLKPIDYAIAKDNLYAFNILSSNGVIVFSLQDDSVRDSVLHIAAKDNNHRAISQIYQYMKKNGIEYYINSQNDKGDTPLHQSVISQSYRAFKTLIDCGADIHEIINAGGKTVQELVRELEPESRFGILAKEYLNKPNMELLSEMAFEAAQDGDIDFLKYALEKGVSPYYKTQYQNEYNSVCNMSIEKVAALNNNAADKYLKLLSSCMDDEMLRDFTTEQSIKYCTAKLESMDFI